MKFCCERSTTNNQPELTDQEIRTIYLFATEQGFANEYLRAWFPELGSYAASTIGSTGCTRAFKQLAASLLSEFRPEDCLLGHSLLNSMPIVACSGKCSNGLGRGIANRNFFGDNIYCGKDFFLSLEEEKISIGRQ